MPQQTLCNLTRIATLVLTVLGFPAVVEATVYNLPTEAAPASLSPGDVLNVGVGGVVPNGYQAFAGSTINLLGGIIGNGLFLEGGNLNIYSGTVLPGAQVSNPNVTMYGGAIQSPWIQTDGVLDIRGGTFGTSGHSLNIGFGVQIKVSAGIVNGPVNLFIVSELTLIGGQVTGPITPRDSIVNIVGTSFLLDGGPIPGLVTGQTKSYHEDTAGTITGTLADGSAFTVIMNPASMPVEYTVNLSQVPEPDSFLSSLIVAGLCFIHVGNVRRRGLKNS
jgi:hypothetical protein